MIYSSRVFSAACARLGSWLGTTYPKKHIRTDNSEPSFWHFAAAVLFLTPIPYLVLYIPFHIFFTAVDLAFNPPPQYFARGTLVCSKSSGSRDNPIALRLSSPSIASSCSSFYPQENYSVDAVPPTYLAGSTNLCNQQSKLGMEPIAQNIESLLFSDYYPCRDRNYCPTSFGGDDIIQNCIDAAASPIGFWLREGSLVIKETLTPGKAGGPS
ncbi:MAG: hypothetical protein WCT03_02055 [Candidatus Obscuribacterales bacterium]|jgi:hypothetical protein